jgi:hypothetical protein
VDCAHADLKERLQALVALMTGALDPLLPLPK